ncbi:IS630 family transposase [Candidatus Neptunichlamydia sp. REUL1]|uniref:IS630 family transposase n=1 Tax=Candidatus Neptunichlamydia sp. REUL1 TaxID=3064277 RepID=UPI00292ED756|nr:IS630 family transposase [Candidatus Neptunochlamydia sp. REUL1]
MAEYKRLGKPIVYIDESGFAHDMPRTHGYSKIGQRCFGTHDWGAKGRTNAIGALLGTSLLTLALFECNINTDAFSIWAEEDLLSKLPSESILVMDNASFHKSKSMQEKIQAAGHTLEYLPPYSPDLNPIEHKWAQAKSKRRKYQCGIDELFKEHCL